MQKILLLSISLYRSIFTCAENFVQQRVFGVNEKNDPNHQQKIQTKDSVNTLWFYNNEYFLISTHKLK